MHALRRGPALAEQADPRIATGAGADAWRFIMRLVLEGEARSRVHQACRAVDLPINVVKTLLILDREPAPAMRDLADHLQADASYCTALVDALEGHGVARRQPHETDRRIKSVVLTPHGRDVLAQIRSLLEVPPSGMSALSRDEQRQLRGLLAKVAAADPVLSPPPGPTR